MTNPCVSILMTAYNREKYIPEAIESVLAQTFEDFELIIVDDGSKDRTVEIARSYTKDPRVRVYVNETNLGDYPNRNRAASLANGKYLKYVDADDLIYPHGLEVMVRAMELFPDAGFGICCPDSEQGPYPVQLSPREAYLEQFVRGTGLLISNGPTFAIIRADAFQTVGGFSGKRFVGDLELWLELAARFPTVKLVMGLVWYRIHAGQELSITFTTTEPVHSTYEVLTKSVSDQCGLLRLAEQRQVLRFLKHRHARNILSLARRGYRRVAWQVYRNSRLSLGDMLRGLRRPPKQFFLE